jgi:predicted permease
MWGRKRAMQDLDQEMREHVEMATRENMERGMKEEEARYAALRKFGNMTRVKEDTRAVWSVVWLEQLVQDIHFALRGLRNSPGFASVAILTLALGIGANTAIFSLIDAVMLRALPVSQPSQLVLLRWNARNAPNVHGYQVAGDCANDLRFGAENPAGCSFSEPMFREIAKANAFAGTAAFANSGRLDLTGNGPATVINGQMVSGDFFGTLGLKPALGRLLDRSDDTPTAAPVTVLSYGYWQSAFGGARDVAGRTVELNRVPFTIVGVAEQRFTGITPGSDYDVWMPLSVAQQISDKTFWRDRQSDAGYWWLTILGRLKAGTELTQAQPALNGLFRNETLYGASPVFHSGDAPAPKASAEAGEAKVAPGVGPSPATGPMAGAPLGPGPGPTPLGPVPTQGGGPAVAGPPPAPAGPGAQQFALRGPDGPSISPNVNDNPQLTLLPAQSGLRGRRGQYADPLYVLMLAVGIILLIACANIAGLLLARASARQQEMSVRLALGAGRARVVRQLLTESVVLALLGGMLGILFAYWGASAIISFVSSNQSRPLGFAIGVDPRVLGFTLATSLLTGILFGIAPAFRSARTDLNTSLKEGGSSGSLRHTGGRWFGMGNALVVAQVALAIVVLVGAGLLVRTLANLRSVDTGFDSHNILIFGIDPQLTGYKAEQIDSFYRDLQGRLSETPGVSGASYSMLPPLSSGLMMTGFHWPGTPQDQESEADALDVGPGFFETMHIPLVAGRKLSASDYGVSASNSGTTPASAPTPVIVNQAFVAKYLGKENPLGKLFGQTEGDANSPASPGYEIVGVVGDAKYSDLRREIHATIYSPQTRGGASFEVRTAADPQAILPAIRKVVAGMSSNLPLYDVKTESQQIDRLLFQERLIARLSGFFALLAMVLACLGLYGLLSYEVSRRTREIGIRMALGAPTGGVLRLVFRQGIVLTILGAIVGVCVSLEVMRYLKAMLYNVDARDPVTIVVVAVLLVLAALAACYIPARRAMRVDPMVALRYE